MRTFTGTSLKTRLYLLVLAAFIPVTILIFYIAAEQKRIETEAIFQKTLMLARAAADEENAELEAVRDLLGSVTQAFMLTRGNLDGFSTYLTNLKSRTKGYMDFGLLRPDGELLAAADGSERRDYGDSAWLATSRERKGLAMGPYQGEHIDGKPALYVALPALDSRGRVVAVAFAALNLNWMNRAVFKQLRELPEGSRLTLLDKTRGMLSYDVDGGRWSVPAHFNPSVRRRILERGSGSLTAADAHRSPHIYAFAPLTGAFRGRHITVVLEIPEKIALASANRIFIRNVALLIVSALMAVLAIWWAGDAFILRRVRAMVSVSRKLATGDLGARIGKIGVRDELSHLAEVFDEMATSLETRIQREAQAAVSLEKSRHQIRELAAHQQEVREQERIRIARELHDQFGQALTILKMDLSWFAKHVPPGLPDAHPKIEAMSRVIGEAMENLRTVTAELRPVILDDFGLAAAIEWQAEEFRNRSGIDCRMETTGFEPDLPKDLSTALFRIFQEALTNILRHANADRVTVRLEAQGGNLQMEILDNGRGITEAEINDPRSFGLLGMRERLHPWRGSVSFAGSPGGGTCVTVRLPMPAKGAYR